VFNPLDWLLLFHDGVDGLCASTDNRLSHKSRDVIDRVSCCHQAFLFVVFDCCQSGCINKGKGFRSARPVASYRQRQTGPDHIFVLSSRSDQKAEFWPLVSRLVGNQRDSRSRLLELSDDDNYARLNGVDGLDIRVIE
jgi:hypothetical protein